MSTTRRYQCPKCNQTCMCWDARAKALICHYSDCSYSISLLKQHSIPTDAELKTAINKARILLRGRMVRKSGWDRGSKRYRGDLRMYGIY